MNYISLSEYRNAWVFRHKDMPVSPTDMAQIKPLSEPSAFEFWQQRFSKEAHVPTDFASGDWANNKSTWLHKDRWQSAWESSSPDLPELIDEHINWADNVRVFFCYDSSKIIETT